MGKLYFTTLSYHHFFNPPPNFRLQQFIPNWTQLHAWYFLRPIGVNLDENIESRDKNMTDGPTSSVDSTLTK